MLRAGAEAPMAHGIEHVPYRVDAPNLTHYRFRVSPIDGISKKDLTRCHVFSIADDVLVLIADSQNAEWRLI